MIYNVCHHNWSSEKQHSIIGRYTIYTHQLIGPTNTPLKHAPPHTTVPEISHTKTASYLTLHNSLNIGYTIIFRLQYVMLTKSVYYNVNIIHLVSFVLDTPPPLLLDQTTNQNQKPKNLKTGDDQIPTKIPQMTPSFPRPHRPFPSLSLSLFSL